jgi:hypothetical protein
MIRALFISLFFASIISFKENKVEEKVIPKVDSLQIAKQNLSLDKIAFDFSAKKDYKNNGYININATLSNANIDTVYLYTWTDHGKQYSLLYDTTKFDYIPESIDNATYPIFEKIPPGGRLTFTASFLMKKQENKIKLDYDFFRIEKQPDMEFRNMDFNKTSSFEQHRQRTILHSTEKTIE